MALNVKPLGDRILVEAAEEKETKKGGIIIPDSAKEKPMESIVVALGTGKLDDNGKKVPFEVKKGDRVLVSKYGGTEIKLDGKEYKILNAEDVLAVIARVLLGLPFVVFGANGLFHFMPTPPPSPGHAGEFIGGLVASGYLLPLMGVIQMLGGACVLSGRLTPFGLILLAPILINIDLFHAVLDPKGAGMGGFLTVLGLALAWVYRESFRGLFNASLPKAPAPKA